MRHLQAKLPDKEMQQEWVGWAPAPSACSEIGWSILGKAWPQNSWGQTGVSVKHLWLPRHILLPGHVRGHHTLFLAMSVWWAVVRAQFLHYWIGGGRTVSCDYHFAAPLSQMRYWLPCLSEASAAFLKSFLLAVQGRARLHLFFPCPSPRVTHFFQDHQFLLVKWHLRTSIWILGDIIAIVVSLLPGPLNERSLNKIYYLWSISIYIFTYLPTYVSIIYLVSIVYL